jgi:flavin reductase (DIM6/NTAB) family NADH-FMN oxidoreductase RutF
MSMLFGPARTPDRATHLRPEEFRSVMRQHAAGVAVITTYSEEPVGFCATSLTALATNPPAVSFSVAERSSSGRAWAVAEYGIVHLLRANQQQTAALFGRPGPGKFAGAIGWHWGPHGQPLLDDVLAWMLVSPWTRLPVGDHLLVVCNVHGATVAPGPGPLLHHAGGYHRLHELSG